VLDVPVVVVWPNADVVTNAEKAINAIAIFFIFRS
jgi:hypothetical protein